MGAMENERVRLVGKYAAILSLVEVALGSILHAFRIPFSGNFLSLNQGLLLCRAALEAKGMPQGKTLPYAVSNVTAVLKSLAPAGKKLGPMLSLSMQGLLFTIGVQLFGVNLLGLCLGMVLLSFWTFLQPLITYYLFFGSELLKAFEYLFQKTLPYHGIEAATLAWILIGLILLKAALAIGVAFLAYRWGGAFQDRLLDWARQKGARPLDGKPGAKQGSPFLLALRDLLHPLFLVSFAATALFLVFSEHSLATKGWIMLRPLAIGFLFFYFSRTLRLEAWLQKLHGTRWESFAKSCEHALMELKKSFR
jgi:hypothetical protein